MTRWKAAAIHLGISFSVATCVACVIYFLWYPPPYFTVAGGSKLAVLILSVDIVLGPLLTLVVYKHGKKSLRFDLGVIATLQIVAFCYGLSIIAQARPVFVVGAVDRFIPVYANDLEDADLAKATNPAFAKRSWTGPVLVAAQLSESDRSSPDVAIAALNGKDVERQPRFYVPYADAAEALLTRAKPLADLSKKGAVAEAAVRDFVASTHADAADLVYLPLHGRVAEYSMVLSKTSRQPLGAIAVDPW